MTSAVAAQDGTVSGTAILLRFGLRRERFRLPWWLLGVGVLLLAQSAQSQNIYGTPEDLAKLRETLGGNTAVIAMSGPTELLDTIGGEVVFEIFSYLAIVLALMNMFLVGRHTRADEETGRVELIRSARVGRRAPVAAVLGLAGLANLAAAVVVFVVAAGTGLPAGGSVLLALAIGGVGLVFAALTAAAAQVFESARGAYGAVALVLGASFVLRAVGDVGNGALSWASPIGWGQRTFPFAGDRWWPLLLPYGAAVLLVVGTAALLDRRDLGAGIVPARLGRAIAPRTLGSPLGLAWRLHRGALAGWTAGLFVMGVAYGSLGDTMEEWIADNPELADFLPGGADDVADSYLALATMICALLASAYGVVCAMRTRGEETSGRAEPVLAAATGRAAWLGSHLTVALLGSALLLVVAGLGEGLLYGAAISDAGQIPRMIGVALVYLPATWLVVGVAALGLGWLPRAAAVVAWVLVGFSVIVALFADSFELPQWLRNLSPFAHTPEAPFESVTALPLVVIGVVAAALLTGGFVGIRRRDVGH